MIDLKQSDRLEVTILMDNYTDALIPSAENVQRPPLVKDGLRVAEPLFAEHGLSLLIRAEKDNRSHLVLMDAGWSKTGVMNNLKVLEMDISDLEGIILSHGHMDHFGGLEGILETFSQKISLILHPDALVGSRFLRLPDGNRVKFPVLSEPSLIKAGASLIKTSSPHLLASGLMTTTGEVERITDFEKGFPGAYLERDGRVEVDSLLDDLSILVNLKGKGLVIVSGCAHSGIVNTVRHAKNVTGIDRIYAIIGGFHLSGPHFDPLIEITINELKRSGPQKIVPMHCTGFKATERISREMPGQFILSSVGTKIIL